MPTDDLTPLSPLDEAGIDAAVTAAAAAFADAGTLEELKAARLAHVGDSSPVTQANQQIRHLDKADKPAAGKILGRAKGRVQQALAARQAELEAAEAERVLREETVDVTVRRPRATGARHPLSGIIDDVSDYFGSLGWQIAEGPELEHEWFNFDALNFGIDHPARQMQDTFYVGEIDLPDGTPIEGAADGLVLRTHTSPVQARTMLDRTPPIYIACPGKVFRTDALDATHTPVFHQVEGLAVDEGLTMAHLKGTLDHFARAMFGPEARTRLRPSFFPFTEPSAEMDLWFP
ncbi:MAG: phenylalanine--tRNA ligase subunit alpha, partial [Actinomycetaceae bacterium]